MDDAAIQVGPGGRILGGLERRLHRLEHRLAPSTSGSSPVRVELDAPDPDLLALADETEHAEAVERLLLTADQRSAHERCVVSWSSWQREYARVQTAAVAASRTIATTRSDQGGHRAALRSFGNARERLDALRADRNRIREAADTARERLEHDDRLRRRHQPEIEAGHRAWGQLTTRLRVRLVDALSRGQLLPLWFVVALGAAPPPGAPRWHDVATALVTYRVSYAISDPIRPLGSEPTADWSPRRDRWHRELARTLDGYR